MIDTADLNHFKEEWDLLKAKEAAEAADWARYKAAVMQDFKDPADAPATSIKVAEAKPSEADVNPSAAPEAAPEAARLQEQLDRLPFKQRYAVAREDGVENFKWRGKDYSSDTKEEQAAKRAGDAPTRDKTATAANPRIPPAESARPPDPHDIKAAKEYTGANDKERETIRSVTGLSHESLTKIADRQNEIETGIETRRLAKAHPPMNFQDDTTARKPTSQEALWAAPTATVKLSPSALDTNTVHTPNLQTMLAATTPGSASAPNDGYSVSAKPATNHQGPSEKPPARNSDDAMAASMEQYAPRHTPGAISVVHEGARNEGPLKKTSDFIETGSKSMPGGLLAQLAVAKVKSFFGGSENTATASTTPASPAAPSAVEKRPEGGVKAALTPTKDLLPLSSQVGAAPPLPFFRVETPSWTQPIPRLSQQEATTAAATPQGGQTRGQPRHSQEPNITPGGIDLRILAQAVGTIESAGPQNRNLALSPKGAEGWMQVKPSTAMDPGYGAPTIFQVANKLGVPFEAKTPGEASRLLSNEVVNKEFGHNYMATLLKHSGGDPIVALAKYNTGPGKIADHLAQGNSFEKLYPETRDYIAKVTGEYNRLSGQSLFPGATGDKANNLEQAAKLFNAAYTRQNEPASGQVAKVDRPQSTPEPAQSTQLASAAPKQEPSSQLERVMERGGPKFDSA